MEFSVWNERVYDLVHFLSNEFILAALLERVRDFIQFFCEHE